MFALECTPLYRLNNNFFPTYRRCVTYCQTRSMLKGFLIYRQLHVLTLHHCSLKGFVYPKWRTEKIEAACYQCILYIFSQRIIPISWLVHKISCVIWLAEQGIPCDLCEWGDWLILYGWILIRAYSAARSWCPICRLPRSLNTKTIHSVHACMEKACLMGATKLTYNIPVLTSLRRLCEELSWNNWSTINKNTWNIIWQAT